MLGIPSVLPRHQREPPGVRVNRIQESSSFRARRKSTAFNEEKAFIMLRCDLARRMALGNFPSFDKQHAQEAEMSSDFDDFTGCSYGMHDDLSLIHI